MDVHPYLSFNGDCEAAFKAERIFRDLETDGQVQVPLQQTFWATRFGMVVDRFGIPWLINCE